MQFGGRICFLFLYALSLLLKHTFTLLNELQSVGINLLIEEDDIVVETLVYGSTRFNNNQNFRLMSSPIDYILKSERLVGSLS